MSILINIASEFTGKKAFAQAEKSTKNLEKSVKSLGKTIGVTLSATAIAAYGRASVKAFAADEAAVKRLATAVDNLGLSYFKTDVEDFIKKTEQSAGILDDVLRPAMQALLTTTGSLIKSQKLLNDAITISRASGIDLATVAQDLANGYVGITKGLKKYNTGLTQSELKTKSFADILGVLLTRSAGAADAYLTTTAYKMEVLGVASENAKETIGKGLVDAFAMIGGGSTAADAAKTMDSIAKAISGVTTAAGTAIGLIVKLYKGLDFLTSFGGITGSNGKLVQQDQRMRELAAQNLANRKGGRSSSPAGTWAKTKQAREAEAAAAKRAKELAALTKKQVAAQKSLTAEQKKQALAKKQSALFDMDQIQIIAALKGKISAEERLRLELQLALITGNEDQAKKLADQLADSIDSTGKLKDYINTLPDAPNPFKGWDAYLTTIEERIKKLNQNVPPTTIPQPSNLPETVYTPNTYVPSSGYVPPTNPEPVPSPSNLPNTQYNQGTYVPSSGYVAPQSVVVQIDGREIARSLQDQSMSAGQVAYLNRRTGGFD